MLAHLPGLVALGVAVVYVVGALNKVSEVNAAGFSPSVVLPLTPIQQLLTLGVSSVATASAITFATVVSLSIVGAALFMERQERRRRMRPAITTEAMTEGATPHQPPASLVGRARLAFGHFSTPAVYYVVIPLFALASLAALFLAAVPTTILPLVTVGPGVLLVSQRAGYRLRESVGLSYATVVIVSLIASSLAYPSFLPTATVVTADGKIVTGRLLVNGEGAVTIGLPDCHVETIPTLQTRSLVIGPVASRTRHRVYELIFGYGHSAKGSPHSGNTRCA
jgi:hypothetical protein